MKWAMIILLAAASGTALFAAGAGAMGVEFDPITLWGGAGLSPDEVDIAEIYDCFTTSALLGIEGLGLAPRGGAGALVRSGVTRPGGARPINTNGGLLSEGYLHGMNTVAEAVLQLQGRCGERTVAGAETCVVTSGALTDGSAVLFNWDGGAWQFIDASLTVTKTFHAEQYGGVFSHDGGTYYFVQGQPNGFLQGAAILLLNFLNQVHEHFRIRVRVKNVALLLQMLL